MTRGNQDECRATRRWVVVVAIGIVIFACLLISVGIVILGNNVPYAATGGAIPAGIHTACSKTFHPQLCVSTLVTYPGVDQLVEPKDFVQATIEATIAQVLQSYSLKVAAPVWGDGDEGVAQQDCVELLHDTLYHLNATLLHMSDLSLLFIADVKTWLSAALTSQDTCLEGFQNLIGGGNATLQSTNDILKESRKFSQLISNSLSLFQTLFSNAGLENKALPGEQTNKSAVPQNPRPMLPMKNNAGFKKDEGNNAGLEQEFKKDEGHNAGMDQEFYQHYGLLDRYDMKEFPMWLSPTDRLLLQLSPADLKPDAVVAQDGSGNYATITDAVKEAPKHLRSRKYVIYVKAGLYLETVKIPKRKTNIMFVCDGKGKTVVVSSKNVKDGSTTFNSATYGAFTMQCPFLSCPHPSFLRQRDCHRIIIFLGTGDPPPLSWHPLCWAEFSKEPLRQRAICSIRAPVEFPLQPLKHTPLKHTPLRKRCWLTHAGPPTVHIPSWLCVPRRKCF